MPDTSKENTPKSSENDKVSTEAKDKGKLIPYIYIE